MTILPMYRDSIMLCRKTVSRLVQSRELRPFFRVKRTTPYLVQSHLTIRHSACHSASNTRSTTQSGRSVTKEFLHSEVQSVLPTYHPPTSGLLAKLPASWIPYAELIRLDKPAGSIYLFFPCLFGTLLASCYAGTPPLAMLSTSILFATGAVIMRGAGCTINDLWDRNLDPHVSRTRLRPIARGAISVPQAVWFTGFQLLAGLGILLQFPTACFWYAVPSLVLVATYPLAKRVTNYPQAVLGLAFSWGALVSFPALGVDLLEPANLAAAEAVSLLYASCVSWTVLYDMIYAHMDVKDDQRIGIKSIAVKHEQHTKSVLTGLGTVQVGLLAGVGLFMGLSPAYYLLTCGGAAATLGIMVRRVNLKDRQSCWWWFRYGVWFTGGAISIGLLQEYVSRQCVFFKAAPTATGI